MSAAAGGDWPIYRVAGTGSKLLAEAIDFGCRITGHVPRPDHPDKKYRKPIRGFATDEGRFVLFWADDERRMIGLPASLTAAEIFPMVEAWLEDVAIYPPEPDHDGSNEKGWEVYTDTWGHIDGIGWHAFLAIRPWWEMYGK